MGISGNGPGSRFVWMWRVGMLAGVFGPWRMRTETEHLVGRKTQSHLINLRAPFGLYS